MKGLLDVVDTSNQPPIVAVTGPGGVGRTTLLAKLRNDLTARGRHAIAVRFSPNSDAVPTYVPDRMSDRHGLPWPALGTISPDAAAHLLSIENSVVLIDDAQWIDPDSMEVLERMAHRITGNTVRCVCAIRTPSSGTSGTAGVATLQRLREDGLVLTTRLRGLRRTEITSELATALEHEPASELVTHLHARSRGIPAALRDAVEALRETGALKLVAGRAYLADSDEPGRYRRLTAAALELGPDAWATAKAAAVLCPLGHALPRLVAEALACTESEACDRLTVLRETGVLHRGRGGASWRFAIPLTATALTACLGPYERQRLAQIAVTALWDGRARCYDDDYTADQIANAGRLIDPVRARQDLLAHALKNLAVKPAAAARWLGAASDLAENGHQYARILFRQAVGHYLSGDASICLATVNRLLETCSDQLGADDTQQLQAMVVYSEFGVGNLDAVRQIAKQDPDQPGATVPSPVTRALALGLLDHWADAADLLAETAKTWNRRGVSALLGGCLRALAEYWCGRTQKFEYALPVAAEPDSRTVERHRPQLVNAQVTALLSTGELHRTEELVIAEQAPEQWLNLSNRALIAAMRGDAEAAIDLGQRCVATDPIRGGDPCRAAMLQVVIGLLVSRGRITKARALVDYARSANAVLAHSLDCAEAKIDYALGAPDNAARKLRSALDAAESKGVLAGVDLCWSLRAELALARDDWQQADHCLTEIERVAATLPTGRATMHALLVRATVCNDKQAAAACLLIAKERAQPLETAELISRLVRSDAAESTQLTEAYEVLGELGALLDRAWMRNLMREHRVPIPGRQQTVAENEQLLSLLVTEGLSNNEIALVLRTSGKSVEGRLSRLFTRTGTHSRIKLANAVS